MDTEFKSFGLRDDINTFTPSQYLQKFFYSSAFNKLISEKNIAMHVFLYFAFAQHLYRN